MMNCDHNTCERSKVSQHTSLNVKNPAGHSAQQEELLDYMLRVLDLETRVRYLEAVEHAARRYVGRIDNGKRANKHRGFKEAKIDLIKALDLFETLEIEDWAKSNSQP